MKTREELLTMASDALESWDRREGELGTSKATFALACVTLAKELPSVKAEELVLRFELTGETRPPHKGEWFINPYSKTPHLSETDWEFSAFPILRVVYEVE